MFLWETLLLIINLTTFSKYKNMLFDNIILMFSENVEKKNLKV